VKTIERSRRHARMTKKRQSAKDRPRLVVFRTKKHISAQLVDDIDHKIIAAATTTSKAVKADIKKTGDKKAAYAIGKIIAEKAKSSGIVKVCFDRAGYRFHGRVEELARGAREGGLEL